MAQQTRQAQHVFRYQSFNINKNQPLGHGSYGAVYKAKCDQLPCAAKLIHATILDPTDPGADRILRRFQQECAFLEGIRHPNIVQYLGITRDPESRLPVLLMELLDESLTKMLESSSQPLLYYVQVDICHDIALAVAYLHSNDIIHRDLSSNNVLMIAGRRAKVTDFGMSKLVGAAPTMTPLTTCPGTLAYMAPEALREPPRYTKKLDCFSEGVIMIQVCTRLWPEPGPRTQLVQDARYPTGIVEVPVFEVERRKNHIDLITPTHALLPIAMDCLNYQEKERPSSEELCQRLAALKESSDYRDNVQEYQDEIRAKDSQQQDKHCLLQQQRRTHEEEKHYLQREKDQLENELLQQRRMHQEEKREIQIQHQREKGQLENEKSHLQREKQELQTQLQEEIASRGSRERQLRQLNQQLEGQKQATAEIQQTNHSLQRQVEQLQQQLTQQSLRNPAHKPHPPKVLTSLEWRDGGKAPFKMFRGAAVVDGDVAYFMNWSGEACSYNTTSKKWSELPKYHYQDASLAVINGQLTAIGGYEDLFMLHTYTDKLLSLNKTWLAIFPPMPTKRHTCSTTTVTSKEHLIVAGGATGPVNADKISTVEVMNTKTLLWSTVASLPQPYSKASAAICGDHLYMLGGWDNKGQTKSVLTCSLRELLQSSSSSSSSSVWHRVADAPAYLSTCAAVNGELLAVGGCDKYNKVTTAIHKYNPTTNSWDLISNKPTGRWHCLVAVLPTNEILAVGGCVSNGAITDKVEIAGCRFS